MHTIKEPETLFYFIKAPTLLLTTALEYILGPSFLGSDFFVQDFLKKESSFTSTAEQSLDPFRHDGHFSFSLSYVCLRLPENRSKPEAQNPKP